MTMKSSPTPGHKPGPHKKPAGLAAKKPAGAKAAAPKPAGAGAVSLPAGAFTLSSRAVIYLNIPKSACTTIKNQLHFMEHGSYIDEPLDIHSHDGLLRSRDQTPENLALFKRRMAQPHFVFTFVRHPGRRAYSCFGEKIFHQSKHSFPKVRDYISAKYGLKLPAEGDTSYDLARHRQNFLCFLDFVADNFAGKTDLRVDAHWGRQTALLGQYQRFFLVDFIGRVEDFSRQFPFVVDQIAPTHRPDLDHRFNEGPKPPFSYEEVADEVVEARLRQIYAQDYQRLGYGLPPL